MSTSSLLDALDLPHLLPSLPLLIASALFFSFLHLLLAPLLSRAVAPKSYAALPTNRDRNNWNNRVASSSNALIVCSFALSLLWNPSGLMLSASHHERVFGRDPRVEALSAIACGYFLWDIVESTVHYESPGFILHAVSCFYIYLLSFKPCMQYYAPPFILWELSTVFLNVHWYCDKTNRTGSTLQFVNGVILLVTFALVRLVYGTIQSYEFYQSLLANAHALPRFILLLHGGGNILLNALNFYWFSRMIRSLRKRRETSKSKPKPKPKPVTVSVEGEKRS